MTASESLLAQYRDEKGDISEHIDTLTCYAQECSSVVELGVRGGVSTLALMSGHPSYMTSFDINPFGNAPLYRTFAAELGVNWNFVQENVLSTKSIHECDLLFIDTLHSYTQLSLELWLHAHKARRWIILHDTVSFALHDEGQPSMDGLPTEVIDHRIKLPEGRGLITAVNRFLAQGMFKLKDHFPNNNGLMVLERRNAD